ncbi:biotin-dependent carboxyltransferase family protein [Lysobacter capsici]|uniref:5-oxoprolinase subunit C family protein n=1 Tax=Lysobacter capsici TaxID=435897 RepID=UPI001C003E4B|nr:biotin-dependent carboxyltransferase family protein [Lysobacter capsici]QWF18946.1 biotin-dependent carboxyltransferase family protein [Lysobacter capsici]
MSASYIEVIAPGPLSHVQDLGRDGWRHLGIARGGALDPGCAALANALVGNQVDAAVLEFTLHGPSLRLPRPLRIAVMGAACEVRFEGDALPQARPIDLPAGHLRLGGMREGVYAWLAVHGGFDLPHVLGSRATDLRGGFGGFEGRALRAGDRLPLGPHARIEATTPRVPRWWIDPYCEHEPQAPIRYRASQAPAVREAARQFGERVWRVHAASNRQGLRLSGTALANAGGGGVSEPVAPGTLQLPPDGQPIVLLADAQTVGGYPRLGHVIAADLPRLAQAGPNTGLRFRACDANEAAAAARTARAEVARLRLAIDARLRG